MEAHLFHAEGRTDGQTDIQTDRLSLQLFLEISRKRSQQSLCDVQSDFYKAFSRIQSKIVHNKHVNKIIELALGAHVLTDPPQHV